jgi:hypothetical protein
MSKLDELALTDAMLIDSRGAAAAPWTCGVA